MTDPTTKLEFTPVGDRLPDFNRIYGNCSLLVVNKEKKVRLAESCDRMLGRFYDWDGWEISNVEGWCVVEAELRPRSSPRRRR